MLQMAATPIRRRDTQKECAMTDILANPVRQRQQTSLSLLRFLWSGSHIRKIRPGDLSDQMRRDLGFADGHIAPPRDLLRD